MKRPNLSICLDGCAMGCNQHLICPITIEVCLHPEQVASRKSGRTHAKRNAGVLCSARVRMQGPEQARFYHDRWAEDVMGFQQALIV